MLNYRRALLRLPHYAINLRDWKSITGRILAIGNLAFALWGYYVLNHSVRLSYAIPPNWLAEFPNTKPILYLMFILNASLLSLLVWGSVQLLQSRPKAPPSVPLFMLLKSCIGS